MAPTIANGPAWHAMPPADAARRLETGPAGLTSAEAGARLARFGPNQIEEQAAPNPLVLLLHQFASPLIFILLIAAAITFVLEEYIDVAVIAAVLLLNAVIGFTQEHRAENSVRALIRLVAPHARVIRDGREHDLESRELVPGDLVLLESGVRVPADLRLAGTTALLVDESALTGESLPVLKQAELVSEGAVVADRASMVYAGTVVASGRGRGYVTATGGQTELGSIATQVRSEERVETPLQHRMSQFARVIGITVLISSALVFAIGTLRGESASHMFMVAVTLAVSAIPEGLPIAVTIALAVGVQRMARRNAIIRRLPAVETLGSTTSIGSDKTGTLTENRMTVERIWTADQEIDLSDPGADPSLPGEPARLALIAGVLANEASVIQTDEGWEPHGDPTEAALLIAAERLGIAVDRTREAWAPVLDIPFEPERQYSAAIRATDAGSVLFVKGAPERVLAMCATMATSQGERPLDSALVFERGRDLAGRGLRLLAMARRPIPDEAVVDPTAEPCGLTFLGLQGMMDPPRHGVKEAIAGCTDAGIRVIMITGDHAETARAIGRELGIATPADRAMTGAELSALDEEGLRAAVAHVPIYARVSPEQKLNVVRALQAEGHVVAVTGDGVNDAPALKAADIGVAMGKSGTDVAREASDMVLADDNFVSITAAVEEGRVTFDNIRKVTFFLVGTGAAVILTIFSVLLLGWPIPFLPAQMLWLNLVTNGLQDIALAFEPGEPDALRRRPRDRAEGILNRLLWERTVLTAIVLATGTLVLFRWELDRGGTLMQAQTVALTTMVIYQSFQAGNARSETRSLFRMSPFSNRLLIISTVAALAVHTLALYLPLTQRVLRVEPIDAAAWGRIVLVASTILIAVEAHKVLRRRFPIAARSHRIAER